MLAYDIKPYTRQELDADATPERYGQPEFIPWGFYDRQSLASNAASLAFFAATNADITISNQQSPAGSMPAQNYFRPFAFTLDFIIGATSQASSGAPVIIDDLLAIQNTARAIFQMKISNKEYVTVPVHALHATGGIYASYQLGTPTASGLGNYGMNWMPTGGYWVNGAFILCPLNSFTVQLLTTGSFTLGSSRLIGINMWGPLGRRVL